MHKHCSVGIDYCSVVVPASNCLGSVGSWRKRKSTASRSHHWRLEDPSVGERSSANYIGAYDFQRGGTVTELDTDGTNPSPSESIVLGTWSNIDGGAYTFKEQNLIYDSSGNLSSIAITTANLTLGVDMNTITGVATTNFYQRSVLVCLGQLQAGPVTLTEVGTRL
jgi:hypothetical protein